MKATFLSRFTPSLMTPEALEAVFVQRHALADQMVQLIRDAALTPSKSHMLLIGPRGIGKTHLIALVNHRVQAMGDLRDHLRIAWLREEEWGVTSFLDFLLRIFRALQAEYPDAVLAARVEALYSLPADEAEQAAAALLKEVSGDRTLLILAENLDDMFDGLGDVGQKRLRAYLQEHPFCSIVASAQNLFNGVSLQTSPFYGFFRIRHLEGLDFEHAVRLLTNIATYEGDRELASFIHTPLGRARIRALHHLAGGSYRVYVIFSQFLTRQSLDKLVKPFMHTLDDLTPYYQARMAWLSPQQRKIIEFLCDRRHAVAVKEIAQHCFITHQTASSQLKDLREKGYVHAITMGRESCYELHEPLMRFCLEVKKQRGEPIRLFVDFLRLWYSQTELLQLLTSLQPNYALEREYVLRALRATKDEDPRIAACLKDYNAYVERDDFERALKVTEELVAMRGQESDWSMHGYCLTTLGRYDEALKSLNKAVELNPSAPIAWCYLGIALCEISRYNEALACFERMLELDPGEPRAWVLRGSVLGILGELHKALGSLNEAIKLDPNDARAWGVRSLPLNALGQYYEALASCDRAIDLGSQSSEVYLGRAESLLALHRWDEGIAALDDALQRFAHTQKPDGGDTAAIVRNLLIAAVNIETKQRRIKTLVELYAKHRVLAELSMGLIQSISALNPPLIGHAAAENWQDIWLELTGDRQEFALPLRLLNAAVRYRESHDRRVLLELPIEERSLLEPLLGIEEPSTT